MPWPKFESSIQLIGFVFGSLLCTTYNVQVIRPLFQLIDFQVDSAPSAAGAETDDEGDSLAKLISDSESEDAQTSTKPLKGEVW